MGEERREEDERNRRDQKMNERLGMRRREEDRRGREEGKNRRG